jgi:cell envelope-related function transcriptional attenuator common domain
MMGTDGVKEENNHLHGKSKRVRNVLILVFSVIFLFAGVVCVYADQMLSKIHYIPNDPGSESAVLSSEVLSEPSSQPSSAVTSSTVSSGEQGYLGGLYHDDAIKNILLLGVDDYQANDPGRSDSMLLVSVDTRHKKLKLTSFMRDMYVAIPGHSSNKLNTAYHFAGGNAAGAQLTVRTIEANFRVDIDRYVIISNSAFDKIVDKLGGVTMTITGAEADLINRYSGDPRRNLRAGTFNLSGKQAHYYSRIRAIGDDFERTERQRKVFTSVANKFKSENIGTIYSVLSETLGLVTTNMTKNEVLTMAASALTYLNYPISQSRIPADGEYYSADLTVGNVLVPDLQAAQERVASFVYEGAAAGSAR